MDAKTRSADSVKGTEGSLTGSSAVAIRGPRKDLRNPSESALKDPKPPKDLRNPSESNPSESALKGTDANRGPPKPPKDLRNPSESNIKGTDANRGPLKPPKDLRNPSESNPSESNIKGTDANRGPLKPPKDLRNPSESNPSASNIKGTDANRGPLKPPKDLRNPSESNLSESNIKGTDANRGPPKPPKDLRNPSESNIKGTDANRGPPKPPKDLRNPSESNPSDEVHLKDPDTKLRSADPILPKDAKLSSVDPIPILPKDARGSKDIGVEVHIRDPDTKLRSADPIPILPKDARGSKDIGVAPSRAEVHIRDPDGVLLQRSVKDSLPETPESSSPMTNTPKIDEAQDVFSFQRMKVSEISQLLELPKNLHSLKIERCDVLVNIPEKVMASIPSLQRLYIINCCSLESFPEPADLRILHIQNCKKLEFPPPAGKTNQYAFLEHLCIGNSCDSLTSLPLNLFPKLRCLSIWDCKNLESLSMLEENQKDFTSLEALEIRDCPNLVYFPKGGLHSPNLTSIWLSNCMSLEELPHQLHTLNSLLSIFINNCPQLVSLPKGGLPSNLSLLSITSCDKLTLMREWGLHMLKCLIKLEIEGGCADLESFPEEKLLPSNLNSLRVSRLLNLQHLDYGLQHLTALKTLEISCCDKLESLPEEGLPSSLSVLCIKECSLLKPKLQKQTGDYWPKIAHISFIETDEEVIHETPRLKQ